MPELKKRKRSKLRSKPVPKKVFKKKGTSRSTWKAFERDVASFFGTRRTPLSGSNSGHNTNSDSLHPTIFIEAKYRDKFSLFELFKEVEHKASFENKVPVVAIKQKGEEGFLLLLRPNQLRKILKLRDEHRNKE